MIRAETRSGIDFSSTITVSEKLKQETKYNGKKKKKIESGGER